MNIRTIKIIGMIGFLVLFSVFFYLLAKQQPPMTKHKLTRDEKSMRYLSK